MGSKGNVSYCPTSPCPLLRGEGEVPAFEGGVAVRFQAAGFLCSGTARTEVLPGGQGPLPMRLAHGSGKSESLFSLLTPVQDSSFGLAGFGDDFFI
jgi:hypothetical protein